ncbi:unnamed protein product [Durusdinium trenchii]|uniref:Uncharacterized protein n=2 Tax=Durusdinium trenchii TaxID=1381693 RepID=A0ABP0Q451_9DINO
MGCGASAEPVQVAVCPPVPPKPTVEVKHEGNDAGNAKEPEAKLPEGDYSEKWPNLCDPDQEFNLLDYVFCLPEGKGSSATMLMIPKPSYLTEEEYRSWKWSFEKERNIKMIAPKAGARDRKCSFEQVELNGKPAFRSDRFFSDFHITADGMEFRCRKEPERALLVHRTLDLEGNVYWKSDGHLCDDLHGMLFTVAQWKADDQVLEIDGKEVAKVTMENYFCPDFFLACYFCCRGEPELCDYVLLSAKAQKERDELNKKAMQAIEKSGGRDIRQQLEARRKEEEERVEKEKREALAARKATAPSGGHGSGTPAPAKWWVCQKCGWKYAQACKPFQGKCTVSRGTACGGPVVLK